MFSGFFVGVVAVTGWRLTLGWLTSLKRCFCGVFTSSLDRTLLAHDELEVGGVIINDIPTWRTDSMPYGGVKDSGLGREGLRWSIEDMTEPRLLAFGRTPSS